MQYKQFGMIIEGNVRIAMCINIRKSNGSPWQSESVCREKYTHYI